MRERDDRHAHARQAADSRGEHAAGVDDDLGLDVAPLGLRRRARVRRDVDPGDPRVGEDLRAALARAVGQRVGQL